MKALPKILLALTAVAALSVAYPAKANLITNGGFETGSFSPWTSVGFGGATLNVQGMFNGISPHSGNFQLVGSGPGSGSLSLFQSFSTTPGTNYTVTFFLALSGSTNIDVTFDNTSIFNHLFSSGFGYTEFTFSVTASNTVTFLEFIFNNGPGIYLDDISVEPAGVGVPDGGATVSLLGCALLGLAALRRRLGC
jgi:hypothetical protein